VCFTKTVLRQPSVPANNRIYYASRFALRFEPQSKISFTANNAPEAARLTFSGGLCSAKKVKAVRLREAKNNTLLATENPLDFLSRGTELTHLGTLSPQL
jgi:hypothetical protein